jgi:pimeloyl-ACP methyl ester carboxylesterase
MTGPDGGWNHQFAKIGDLNTHYVREGNGQKLILLHGWPELWWGWHRNIPALAKRFDVIAPDLRGFGDTRDLSGTPPGPDVHAKDILALADTLRLDRFGLVAHDVGAYVAQQIARLVPERLTGLFFFNGPYPGIGRRWADSSHIKEIWYQSFNQLPWAPQLVGHSRETCRIFFEAILRHWAHDQSAVDGLIEPFVDNFMKPGNLEGGFAWYRSTHAARMALVRDGAPVLPKIELPSRFYWGRHDPVIPCAWADRLSYYFVGPQIEIAEGAGHFVHLETPQPANERIIDFFAELV